MKIRRDHGIIRLRGRFLVFFKVWRRLSLFIVRERQEPMEEEKVIIGEGMSEGR